MTIRTLVVGASIAGPALAHWLHRWGAEVTVVERAPALRPGGQAVDARGVAREVIRRMGLDETVRAACTDTAGSRQVDADGRVLNTFSAEDFDGDGFIAEIEILRGDLSRVLYEHTCDGVEYRFDERVEELRQDDSGVEVRLHSGERQHYDLVVGADGLHSSIRSLVFGPPDRYLRHLGYVLAFYTVPNEFGLDRWAFSYEEVGRAAGVRPIRDATAAMAYFGYEGGPPDLDPRDTAAQKRLLRERIEGMGWWVPTLLSHLDTAPDFYFDQCAQVQMDSWSRGRVALLGDAAFCPSPMSGQGTGLALVGAYVLAGELARTGWDPEAGFAGYERRMRPFVAANQEVGRLGATAGTGSETASPAEPDMELFARAIHGIELPDYDGASEPAAPNTRP